MGTPPNSTRFVPQYLPAMRNHPVGTLAPPPHTQPQPHPHRMSALTAPLPPAHPWPATTHRHESMLSMHRMGGDHISWFHTTRAYFAAHGQAPAPPHAKRRSQKLHTRRRHHPWAGGHRSACPNGRGAGPAQPACTAFTHAHRPAKTELQNVKARPLDRTCQHTHTHTAANMLTHAHAPQPA